ncbi:hypothetical protein [Cellulomonas sp.]|uniref:hypothetical protein n=1 Tax=Cellulomonas sp. TaxID=40001 RepID=UPI001B1E7635|nr:hypothetical protein [Cellulomonas sp.]MBO9554716.1 hypothetical protein [Cellulomonas sp.]
MVLTCVLIGFVALAAIASCRWVLTRVDALGRIAPFPRISVGLSLVAALACAVPLVLHAQLESKLAGAASEVVGAPVQVHCQTIGEAFVDVGAELGYVRWGADGVPEKKTLIKSHVCGDLRAWLRSSKAAPSLDQVVAVHVLTHEAMHMAGITNEAAAECAAMQRDQTTAVLLGASPAEGLALARRYWTEVYPNMPDGYRGECNPGVAIAGG